MATHLSAVFLIAFSIVLTILVLWYMPQTASLVARASTLSIAGFLIAFMFLAAGAARGAVLCRRGAVIAGVAVTALSSLLMTQSALLGVDFLPRMRGVLELAEHLRPALTAATRLYCVNLYLQPIPFYLQRSCTLVGYRGELDFGLQQEPWRFIPDLKGFQIDWAQQHDALAILRPQDYQQLESLGTPMRVIYTAPSYVAVVRE